MRFNEIILFILGAIQYMLAEAVSKDGKTAHECEVCGKVLKNINSYQNHISITHGIKKRAGKN